MGNLYISDTEQKLLSFPYVGGSYSGTGDLFASCLAAGIARGDDIPSTIETAGAFLEAALIDTVKKTSQEMTVLITNNICPCCFRNRKLLQEIPVTCK